MAVNKVSINGTDVVDLTDTTATASDVASGKVFYTASGAKATGTASGGVTPTGTIEITANGTYDVTQYASADVDVAGSDDPYPVRNDGKTHLWVVVDDMARPDVTIRYRQSANNAILVEWGDGSSDYYTGTGSANHSHNYDSTGTYEIILSARASGYFNASGYSASAGIMGSNTDIKAYNLGRLVAVEMAPVYMGSVGTSNRVPSYCFSGCKNLEKLTLCEGMTQMSFASAQIFYGTDYNLRELSLPSTMTTMHTNIFMNLTNLERVTIARGATSGRENVLRAFYELSKLTSLTLPSGFIETSVSNYSLSGCSRLKYLTLPDDLDIGISAFSTAVDGTYSGLTSARKVVANGLTCIPTCMFDGAAQLQSFTIPSGVTTIGAGAFANCHSLASITFLPTTPPTVADASAWTNLPTTCEIHVPAGTLADYTAAANYPDPATYTYVED